MTRIDAGRPYRQEPQMLPLGVACIWRAPERPSPRHADAVGDNSVGLARVHG